MTDEGVRCGDSCGSGGGGYGGAEVCSSGTYCGDSGGDLWVSVVVTVSFFMGN